MHAVEEKNGYNLLRASVHLSTNRTACTSLTPPPHQLNTTHPRAINKLEAHTAAGSAQVARCQLRSCCAGETRAHAHKSFEVVNEWAWCTSIRYFTQNGVKKTIYERKRCEIMRRCFFKPVKRTQDHFSVVNKNILITKTVYKHDQSRSLCLY